MEGMGQRCKQGVVHVVLVFECSLTREMDEDNLELSPEMLDEDLRCVIQIARASQCIVGKSGKVAGDVWVRPC